MTPPRYQEIVAGDVPESVDDDGTRVRVICGSFRGKRGPVEGIAADPRYLDVSVPPGTRTTLPVETELHAFAYVFDGSGSFRDASRPIEAPGPRDDAGDRSLVLFDRGDAVTVQAGERGMRFLLVSGRPLREPVAWHGPIVMNTDRELQQAFDEYRMGTFLRHGARP